MIQATLSNLSQEVDLSTGDQANFLTVLLPNGVQFRALIADDAAQEIVKFAVLHGSFNPASPAASTVQRTEQPTVGPEFKTGEAPDGSESLIFGGAEEVSAPSPPTPPTPRSKGRLVGADNYGNPIVRYDDDVDASSVVSSAGDGDEDGVRQI